MLRRLRQTAFIEKAFLQKKNPEKTISDEFRVLCILAGDRGAALSRKLGANRFEKNPEKVICRHFHFCTVSVE
jgi:hypothetical protein